VSIKGGVVCEQDGRIGCYYPIMKGCTFVRVTFKAYDAGEG
jgi:hypothetical protein